MLSFSNGNIINLGNIKGSKGDKGDKGDSGLNGKDGVGIQNVDVSADGALTVTLTNGTVLNLGNIKGADGLGITKAEINTSGELVLTYSNGDVKNLGKVSGENGKDGANGADGLGIKSLTLSPSGELVVTMSDNSISNLGNIKGDKGDRGEQGQQGLQGSKGADGRGIAKTELVNGELVITYTDGTSDNLGSVSGTAVSDSILMLKFDTLEDGTLQVSLKDGYYSVPRYIVIPSTFEGKTVTTIAERGFAGASNLVEVYLPETISTIGKGAFLLCSKLMKINIPNTVTEISPQAFYECSNLNSITIPNTVTKIGEQAFYNCSSLNSITIPSTVTKICPQAFAGTGLTEAVFENPSNWQYYYLDDNWSGATNKKCSVTDLTNDQMSNKKTAAELLKSEEKYQVGSWYPPDSYTYSKPDPVYRYRTYERVG